MRQFLLGLSLSMAFIAGCIAAQLSQLVIPPAHAQNGPARWEYFCSPGFSGEAQENTVTLNRLGGQGWELVQFVEAGYAHQICFKRPIYPSPPSAPSPAIPLSRISPPSAAHPPTAPSSPTAPSNN